MFLRDAPELGVHVRPVRDDHRQTNYVQLVFYEVIGSTKSQDYRRFAVDRRQALEPPYLRCTSMRGPDAVRALAAVVNSQRADNATELGRGISERSRRGNRIRQNLRHSHRFRFGDMMGTTGNRLPGQPRSWQHAR